MNIALAKTETMRASGDIFAAARDRLPGAGKVAEVRQQAFEAYERVGLRIAGSRTGKYTDLRALMREVLPLAASPDAKAFERAKAALALLPALDACRLVLVDGVVAPALSNLAALEAGVRAQMLREVLEDDSNAARADLLANGAASRPDDRAERGDGDRWRRDHGGQWRRARKAAAYRTCCNALLGGDLHPFVPEARPECACERLWRALSRPADTKSYQVNDALTLWLGDAAPVAARAADG